MRLETENWKLHLLTVRAHWLFQISKEILHNLGGDRRLRERKEQGLLTQAAMSPWTNEKTQAGRADSVCFSLFLGFHLGLPSWPFNMGK